MIRFAADENFNNDILRALKRSYPQLDIERVQDTEVYQADDPKVLEWAASQNRILLTHDINTMIKHGYERVVAGLPMPGIFAVQESTPIGVVIDELVLVVGASEASDWENLVTHLPIG